MLDIGCIEVGGADVHGKIYYQQGYVPAAGETLLDAPLVDGPRGFCLDLTNISGRVAHLTVYGLADTPLTVNIGQGDPVTGGPAAGRSRTAAQLASLGFTTRGNVGTIEST